jgi:hypothetical protein
MTNVNNTNFDLCSRFSLYCSYNIMYCRWLFYSSDDFPHHEKNARAKTTVLPSACVDQKFHLQYYCSTVFSVVMLRFGLSTRRCVYRILLVGYVMNSPTRTSENTKWTDSFHSRNGDTADILISFPNFK